MSLWVSERECKRLYEFDKNLMFGVAAPYGTPLIFLARLMSRDTVGADDIENRRSQFLVIDIPNLLHLQNRKGERARENDFRGLVPTLMSWPGESVGNEAVMSGDFVSILARTTKPQADIYLEHKQSVRQAGRAHDRFVKDAAEELADEFKHLSKQSSPNTKLLDKHDIKEQIDSPLGQKIERFRQNDYESTNEYRYLRDNGLL